MTRKGFFALPAIAALAACSRTTPEQQVVGDAAAALGGRDRITAVKTLVLEGEGTQYNPGQDVTPGASGQTFAVTGYRRAIDVAGGRARTELTRQPNFTFFQGPAPQRQVSGIDGAVAYTPGAAVHMFAARFLADLAPRNLRIDRIAPLHGMVVPYAQFLKAATAPPGV